MLALLEECIFEFWGPNVVGEVCLTSAFAPQIPDFHQSCSTDFLFSVRLGEQHRNHADTSDGLHLPKCWFGSRWDEASSYWWQLRALEDHDALHACFQNNAGVIVDACTPASQLAEPGQVAAKAFQFEESTRRSEMESESTRRIQSMMYIPLHGHGGCIGVLCLASYNALDFTEAIRETFLNIAQITGSHLQVLQMQYLLAKEREVIELDRARHKQLATDYRSLLNDMVPPHIVDKLSRAHSLRTSDLVWRHHCNNMVPPTHQDSSPSDVQSRLGSLVYAKQHDMVVILFTDIKGFTCMSEHVHPAETMLMLDDLFGKFDDIIDAHSDVAYKVETIGDAYMVAFGLFGNNGGAAELGVSAITVAAEMIEASQQVPMPGSSVGRKVEIRAGLHIGCIMSGVIGKKIPHYCMFGDTVNTASRMESSGLPSKIHVSQAVMEACRASAHFRFTSAGVKSIKGKGPMNTFLVDPQEVLGWNAGNPRVCQMPPHVPNILALVQGKPLNNMFSWILSGLRRLWPSCLQLFRVMAPRV